jgi:two-component system phosphate regulon sensor histidine kinase PhoR
MRPAKLTEDQGQMLIRSVMLNQLLLTGVCLAFVGVTMAVIPSTLGSPFFFTGSMVIFFATAVASVVPWPLLPKNVIILLPVLDILGIGFLHLDNLQMGVSVLLVFPVMWLASHFGRGGATLGPVLCAVAIWGGVVAVPGMLRASDLPLFLIAPVVLLFMAASTHATASRAQAQRKLLTQQGVLFQGALRRSRRQEQTLDEIFNTVDFGVVAFDASGTPNFVNREYREMLARHSVPPGQLVVPRVYGDDRVTPIPEEDRPATRAFAGEAIDRALIWMGEPGQPRSAQMVSARPLHDESGAFDGGVMVCRDVTAEMRAIQARDDLVASVSHELRTPLTSILGYLELALDDERLPPDTRGMLAIASKNSDRLLEIVSELLTAASDSKRAMLLNFGTCDLSAIVTEAIESIRPVAAEREISFQIDALPPLPLEADAFRLRQVVDNVLSNAVKYNVRSGRIRVAISVVPESDGMPVAMAKLRITDTGRGMSEDEQAHLFERFYRADSVRRSTVHGTGLGLSISRDIMRQHGGDLRLEAVEGKGTSAIVTIPYLGTSAEVPTERVGATS